MNGVQKFLACLLSVVVAVSLGVTVYYFARNTGEELSLSQVQCFENVGDEFNITINQKNADVNTTLQLASSDSSVVEFVSKDKLTYTFKAVSAGNAVINLLTNNNKYSNISCAVSVADGSSTSPYYIRNAQDLNAITTYGLDKNYKQITNIDMAGTTISPIGATESSPFTGTFTGNGYVISKLTMTGNVEYAGLFGYVGQNATVSNVTLDNVSISTNSLMIGAIVAVNQGTVADCTVVSAHLETSNLDAGLVGGVVAQNESKVLTSSFNGKIFNGAKLGGVVAQNNNARVQDCYARGEFYPATTSQMGGVVCYNNATTGYRAIVVDCYSTMFNNTTSNTNVGMVLFSNLNSDTTTALTNENSVANRVYGNHYATTQGYTGINGVADDDAFVSAIANKSVADSYTTKTLGGTNSTWNFANIWSLSSQINDGYPTLLASKGASNYVSDIYIPGVTNKDDPDEPHNPEVIVVDKSVITTPAQLVAVMQGTEDGYSLNNNYTLGADIDMSGTDYTWTAKTLNGSISGLEIKDNQSIIHKISNLKISASENGYVGVFSIVNGMLSNITFDNLTIESSNGNTFGTIAGENRGIISNVTITNSNLNVKSGSNVYVGGVVGLNSSKLTDIQTSNLKININSIPAEYVGGIVGRNDSLITNATADTVITANTELRIVGGIAGYNVSNIADANVSLTYNGNSNYDSTYFGGLIGQGSSNQTLKHSKVKSIVLNDCELSSVGGIAGKTGGTINTCEVNSIELVGSRVAGLVSILDNGAKISDCATRATIKGTSEGAGIVNELNDDSSVSKCYIATAFECGEKANVKYETQTKFRQGEGGDITDCVLNKSVMGSPKFRDSKRQYGSDYAATSFLIKMEKNTPHDHLRSANGCADASTFADLDWDVSSTSVWNFTQNGPVLK